MDIELTLITPTADQPFGIRLCEQYMTRQTLWGKVPIQWIVSDDGLERATLTAGQQHIHRDRAESTGAQSLCRNLLAALPHVQGKYVVFIEHDDRYGPTHLQDVWERLERGAQATGDTKQRYYNLPERCWLMEDNIGACLAQTAITSQLLPVFERTVQERLAANNYGVDGYFWKWALKNAKCSTYTCGAVVGIKGLPGRPGLGLGHRPKKGGWAARWKDDQSLTKLHEWIGEDVLFYQDILMERYRDLKSGAA